MEASDSNAWFVATQEIRFVLIACMELLEFDFFFFPTSLFQTLKTKPLCEEGLYALEN